MDKSIRIQTYYDRNYRDTGTDYTEPSLTDQDYKMHSDVNYLLDHMSAHSRTPLYGVSDSRTFEDWSNEMAMLKRRFNNLSDDQKTRFGNPQNFLKWCSNPDNYKEYLPEFVEQQRQIKSEEEYIKAQEENENRLAGKIAKAIKGE